MIRVLAALLSVVLPLAACGGEEPYEGPVRVQITCPARTVTFQESDQRRADERLVALFEGREEGDCAYVMLAEDGAVLEEGLGTYKAQPDPTAPCPTYEHETGRGYTDADGNCVAEAYTPD